MMSSIAKNKCLQILSPNSLTQFGIFFLEKGIAYSKLKAVDFGAFCT